MFQYYIKNFFINYELTKLDVFHPNYANYLIILLFTIQVVLTVQKNSSSAKENILLCRSHTEQLKGIAIFFVVLGHLWVHVTQTEPHIILSGDSVAIFLLLSGFGLTLSSKNRNTSFKEFFLKRMKRIMVPYWMITILILILDYLILGRSLKADSLLMTIIGINTRVELRHLDYARWFVTFILLWYLLFYLFFIKYKYKYSSILLITISFIFIPFNYYFFNLSWYQAFSFPVGCLVAIHYNSLLVFYKKNHNLLIIISNAIVLYILLFKILMSYNSINQTILYLVPNIILEYYSEWNSLILAFSIIILTGCLIERRFRSKTLLLLGKYSYEIFLLHGAFLIKYDPIIKSQHVFSISCQFLLLFTFVTILSILIYQMHQSFYNTNIREIIKRKKQ